MADIIIYHFWSETCPPCNHIKPAVADLKDEFGMYTWKSVNIKQDPVLTQRMNVTSIPCIVATKDGKETGRHKGTTMMGYYQILRTVGRS